MDNRSAAGCLHYSDLGVQIPWSCISSLNHRQTVDFNKPRASQHQTKGLFLRSVHPLFVIMLRQRICVSTPSSGRPVVRKERFGVNLRATSPNQALRAYFTKANFPEGSAQSHQDKAQIASGPIALTTLRKRTSFWPWVEYSNILFFSHLLRESCVYLRSTSGSELMNGSSGRWQMICIQKKTCRRWVW